MSFRKVISIGLVLLAILAILIGTNSLTENPVNSAGLLAELKHNSDAAAVLAQDETGFQGVDYQKGK